MENENTNKRIELSKNNLRCLKCNSTMTYFRLKTEEKVCRNCGHIEKLR